jgi:hypothetical protein
MKKIIHVNQHNIRANCKDDSCEKPVISVKTYKGNHYGYQVTICGPSKVIYSPYKPLKCGAKVWIETYASVIIDDESEID